MKHEQDVVIVSGVRTPIGKFGGALKDVKAHQLGALAAKEALSRAGGLDPADLDEVIAGDCLQCFDEANTARTIALAAGIPDHVPAYTIQRQCASSMQALFSGVQAIRSNDADTVLVLGVESMSSGPYYSAGARFGCRLMNHEFTDSVWELLHSGSRQLGEDMIMGQTAENLAGKYTISREDQDQVSLESHQKAEAAITNGHFAQEILPVELPGKKGATTLFDQDEHPRFGITIQDLQKLKPVFKKDGTVTAGNSSGLNDGAAAAVIMTRKRADQLGLAPMAVIQSQAAAGVDPALMGYGPVPATEKALAKSTFSLQDIELIELNEAFAAQYLACERALGLDRSITNVNGSGISLGHPVGCTGLRITVSLIHEMARRDVHLGLATLCVGGGMGMATIVTRD